MNNLPPRIVLSVRPKEYLVQGPGHCGAYSVKGILSAFSKDKKGHPKEYHPIWLGRLTGGTFGKNYWVNVLKHYGVDAEFKTAQNLSPVGKINLLKSLLANNTPVMIRIGNGYFRSNTYNSVLGKIVAHLITLWGYDDKEKVFYVYDSGLTKKLYDRNVPIGNTKRTYNEILRDWNFGTWQLYTWLMVGRSNYLYIEIRGPVKTEEVHIQSVSNGLEILNRIFNDQQVNYRVLGSVLVAALNGKPHRTLGDIDVLVADDDYPKVLKNLEKEGYKIEKKHKIGFHWTEAQKDGYLGFTFLLVGKFFDKYFSYNLTNSIELRISSMYLQSTEYKLLGVNFTGIPLRSIYEGLKISSLNPKRTLDRKVVMEHLNNRVPDGETLAEAFKVYLFGIEIPYAYTIFSQLYNFYGGLRVLLGKRYEIWD